MVAQSDPMGWVTGLDAVVDRISPRFGRAEPQCRAWPACAARLALVKMRCGWQLAGVLGDALNQRDAADAAWVSALAERLAAAQAVAPALSGRLLTRQHRWTASCQCNVTLGPDGLRAAAKRAAATRRSTRLRP